MSRDDSGREVGVSQTWNTLELTNELIEPHKWYSGADILRALM